MIFAAMDVQDSKMTIGDFVLVNSYLLQLYLPLGILGFAYREIKLAIIDMEGMYGILNEKQEIIDDKNAKTLKISKAELEFDNVNFSYESNRQILKTINFKVSAGKKIAIVGSSGAGKSTISRLLFRFYDTTSGSIKIDGQDIRHITQSSLRQAIGIVPQDTVLFNDTIYYNIQYGNHDACADEVYKAAKHAKIHDFILSLPNGYDTLVGERGLKLSGGEKQRVAIARTILKKPSIFLFDEATSALDSHTEKEIQASLDEVSQNRTTITIAHRLSTIIDADEILVMDKGSILERGTHQSLLGLKGTYHKMWQKQINKKKAN
jgi:ATP-binding cassette subfamily B protein